MEQEYSSLSEEFQKILLTSSSVAGSNAFNKAEDIDINGDVSDKLITSQHTDLYEEATELDTPDFDKWVPFLRSYIEKGQLKTVTGELETSIDDNFNHVEYELLHDSQLNDNLESFITSISEIQSTIQDDLLNEVQSLQSQLNQSTNDLIFKKQSYLNNKKTTLKIAEARIIMNKVVRLLELSSNCQTLIQERNFFKALQSLDTLERMYLQEFKNTNFDFLKEFYNSVPVLKSIIEDECLNLIKNSFNSNLGKNLTEVGKHIFSVYKEQLYPAWIERKTSMKLYSNFCFNSPAELSTRDQNVLEGITSDHFFNLDEFHDAILIFERLNELPYLISEFEKEYEFRKSKIIYPLSWKKTVSNKSKGITTAINPNNIPGDIAGDAFTEQMSIQFFFDYFSKLIGFLLYDIHLNNSTDFLLVNSNQNATNEFWKNLMNRLYQYLKHFLNAMLNTEEELIEFKDLLAMFICILENYKLNIDPLYDILVSILEKYCKLKILNFEKEFTDLLNEDDFMPLNVNSRSLYEKVIKVCWLTKDKQLHEKVMKNNQDNDEFSVILPFSPLYPMTTTIIKKIYNDFIKFTHEFYRLNLSQINKIIINNMEAITDIVNNMIREKLDSTSREEISQILINLDYFIIGAKEMSNYMSKENVLKNPDIEIRLSAIKNFIESRKMAETRLIELIDSKISDILETVNFEWNSKDTRQEPDITFIDLGQFLEMMFASTLVNLPYSVQTLLIFREFDSLTRKILEILLTETPTHITQESVHNFGVDIEYLQSIIPKIFSFSKNSSAGNANSLTANNHHNTNSCTSTPVTPSTPTFSGPTIENNSTTLYENNIKSLEETFTELNQCIELMRLRDPKLYSDPEMRMKKFSRIKSEEAKVLLEKVRSITFSNEESSNNSDPNNDTSSDEKESTIELNTKRLANFFNRR